MLSWLCMPVAEHARSGVPQAMAIQQFHGCQVFETIILILCFQQFLVAHYVVPDFEKELRVIPKTNDDAS